MTFGNEGPGATADAGGERALRPSPIVDAIRDVEANRAIEIRVHLTKRWLERDALARARALFAAFGMGRGGSHDAVLLYVNLRRRRLAVAGRVRAHATRGTRYWEMLAARLARELRATSPENAIARIVREIGGEPKPGAAE